MTSVKNVDNAQTVSRVSEVRAVVTPGVLQRTVVDRVVGQPADSNLMPPVVRQSATAHGCIAFTRSEFFENLFGEVTLHAKATTLGSRVRGNDGLLSGE